MQTKFISFPKNRFKNYFGLLFSLANLSLSTPFLKSKIFLHLAPSRFFLYNINRNYYD